MRVKVGDKIISIYRDLTEMYRADTTREKTAKEEYEEFCEKMKEANVDFDFYPYEAILVGISFTAKIIIDTHKIR